MPGGQRFPEGPTHMLPLLMRALPGVDPNDFSKCMVRVCSRQMLVIDNENWSTINVILYMYITFILYICICVYIILY